MPILKAKKGELDAIESMLPYPHVIRDMLPILKSHICRKNREQIKNILT